MTTGAMKLHGIPTTYKGTRTRSRLEAQWLCFLDLCGIEWLYEPFDCRGYIPDLLVGDRLVCEIKPFTWFVRDDGPIVEARERLRSVEGAYQTAILGLDPSACELDGDRFSPRWEFRTADLYVRFGPVLGTKPLRFADSNDFSKLWRIAGSRVRWKPTEARP